MKRNLLILFLGTMFIFSCSSDSEVDTSGETETPPVEEVNPLVGIWDFSGLDLTGVDATTELVLINGILTALIDDGCDISTLTFNEDDTAVVEFRDFSDQLAGLGGGIPMISCPETLLTEEATWSLEDDQLTITQDGEEQVLTVVLEGDTLTIPAELIDENTLAGTGAVFTRR
ncbi:lipocalin family protein [Spongiimicrobium salis]|uniref:lipocalin family protein n=1 Tax=Spongiimicrobium salis TaxID=1667022 RepID=UPI00374C97C5